MNETGQLVVATKPWNLSCPDWRERLRTGRSLIPDHLPLNRTEGNRAVAVFDKLRLFDVPGTPTMAEAGADWFRDVVRALFGSYDPVIKMRYIRELFLLVAKKNNKTTGGALLMLTALLLNQRPSALFLLTGPVHKTADDAFAAAAGAIALDNVLHSKLHVRDHLKTIVHRETQAKLEIMTFEPDVLTGKKVVGALIDEHHLLGKMPRANKAMVQLRGGMMPFPEAFLAIITTQSDDAPAGVFDEDLTKAREIRDGQRQGAMLPLLYEFPEEMQLDPARPWRNPANWHLVNPNVGLSITLHDLERACKDEEAKGEAALRLWASQHLNIQIGMAMHAHRWRGADYWEASNDPTLTLEELLKRCEVVTVGIDGGGLDDLLGLAVVGREIGTGRWLHWGHAWCDETVLELRKSEASTFRGFEADGDLTICEIGKDDIEQLAEYVRQVEDSGLLDRIGVDTAGIGAIVDAITELGIDFERIVGIPQGWKLVGAIKTAERKLKSKELVHGGRRLMAYSVGNAKTIARGNAVLITKETAGAGKIDPLLALLNSVALMAMNPKPRKQKLSIFFV